ncbi:MAG: permease [Gammaproteobacteria bacterium]|nr:permease [Gammaproteobacteria bacterium]
MSAENYPENNVSPLPAAQASVAGAPNALLLVLVPVLITAGLLLYKGRTSLIAIHKVRSAGTLSTKAGVVTLGGAGGFLSAVTHAAHYLLVIWPALAFGVLIGAAFQAFVPRDYLSRFLSAGTLRAQLAAGAAGAPLMLCSCCVAPVFSAVYEKTARLGPSLAVMLASPSLNPAALILTAALFTPRIAVARVLMALVAVGLGGVLIERLFAGETLARLRGDPVQPQPVPAGWRQSTLALLGSLRYILRTLPMLVLGALLSAAAAQYVPHGLLSSSSWSVISIALTAAIAVPLALPTFFEIPLAVGLLAAGAPAGVAVALLFAGPAVNLPSLLNLARDTHWKVAAALAAIVWVIAVVGGLAVNA